VFLMPMTLYQLGSASLDGVSFSMIVLTGALYMRAAHPERPFKLWMLVVLTVCLFSLATSRINLIVLTLLPFTLYTLRRSRAYLISCAIAVLLAVAWTAFVFATVRGGHGNDPEASSQIVTYYLHHPFSFISVLYVTLTNGALVQFYWQMFVGVFGWSGIDLFDGTLKGWGVFLSPAVYMAFTVLLVSMAVITFQRDRVRLLSRGPLSLVAAALGAVLLIFPILLATWTPQPAKFIYGIQGRYFIPTVILLSFAMFDARLARFGRGACCALLFTMAVVSVVGITPTLLSTWWLK
jgi:uncharacterized membrane protein